MMHIDQYRARHGRALARKYTLLSWSFIVPLATALLTCSPHATYAQQGSSRVIPSQFRVANGASIPGSLVYRNGNYEAIFISYATNLTSSGGNNFTDPRGIYRHDCRTGKTTLIGPREFIPYEVVATSNRPAPDNQVKTYIAAYGRRSGRDTIAYYDGSVWRFNTVSGQFKGLQIDMEGRVYLLTDNNLSEWHVSGTGSRTILGATYLSMTDFSVSEDGRRIVVRYVDNDGDQPIPYRLILSRRDNNTFVAKSDAVSIPSLVNTTGTMLIENGTIYRIVVDPSAIRLIPMLTDVIPPSGRPIDFSEDILLYTTDGGQTVRVFSVTERVDLPLEWWDGTTKHRRCIQNGYILFAATDTANRRVVRGDTNLLQDLFLYEITLKRTTGITTGPMPRNGNIAGLAVGRTPSLIAFTSSSNDIVAGKTTPHTDVFVQSGQQLFRVAPMGEPNNSSFDVNVDRSGNTNQVVFASYASNLVPGDTNQVADVFLWNNGWLSCITCASSQGGNAGDSFRPSVAPTGIFFLSTARLVGMPPYGETFGSPQAYRRFPDGSFFIFRPSSSSWFVKVDDITVSPDGQWIALTATIDAATERFGVFLYRASNLVSPVSILVLNQHDCYATSVSNNGLVVFHTTASLSAADNNSQTDVYLWNHQNGQVKLISRNSAGFVGGRESFNGTINASGTRVAFNSLAGNLTAMDMNIVDDVFVYDLQRDALYCASLNDERIPVGGSQAKITGDGSHVAFATGVPELAQLPFANGLYVAIHEIGCSLLGDINGDGTVDDADLLQLLTEYGRKGFSFSDINLDGEVDDGDLLLLLLSYGSSCGVEVAGGNDGGSAAPPSPEWDIHRTSEGLAVLHFNRTPRVTHIDEPEVQSRDIDIAVKEKDWPYPTVGGFSNLWKHSMGDPSDWTHAERLTMKHFLTPAFSDGDFQPASGIPGYWNWEQPIINWQANSNTYVRLTPKLSYTMGCLQGVQAEAQAVLDLKFFGVGADELAKARAFAGITPGYIGYGVEAYLSGSKVWGISNYVTQNSWTWNDTRQTSKNLFDGAVGFNILGVPMVVTYSATGYLRSVASLTLNATPPSVQASYTPAAGVNGSVGAGLGFYLFGTYFMLGLEVQFNPLVELSLPMSFNAGLQQQNNQCVFNAGVDVRLRLRALRGQLNFTAQSSCMGLLGLFCKKCQPNTTTKIWGFIPGKCCSDQCYVLLIFPYGKKQRIHYSGTVFQWSGLLYDIILYQNQWSVPIK